MIQGLRGLPTQLDRYVLQELIGQGGMGRVVAALDPKLNRRVAIKIVEHEDGDPESLPQARFMFHREARSMAALDHPNILRIFDYSGPDATHLYLVCEYVEGVTLESVLQERGSLGLRNSICVMHELASALCEAHHRGIIHRDIKPENIFWTGKGRIVLGDFGIAKAFEGASVLGKTIRFGETELYGTPAYMAPEQINNQPIGPHTDLFVLGSLLHEFLGGRPAFGTGDVYTILERVRGVDYLPLPEAPSEVQLLIHELLQVDPSKRLGDSSVVQHRCRLILNELGVQDPRQHLSTNSITDRIRVVTQELDPLEAKTERVLFGKTQRESIRLPATSEKWGTFLARAPIVLAMISMAIALGSGVHLFKQLSGSPGATPGPEVGTQTLLLNQAESSVPAPAEEIYIRVLLPGEARIVMDGREIGLFQNRVGLSVPVGIHTLEVIGEDFQEERKIHLLKDTFPTFDFSGLSKARP